MLICATFPLHGVALPIAAAIRMRVSGRGQFFCARMRGHGTEPPQFQIRVYAHQQW